MKSRNIIPCVLIGLILSFETFANSSRYLLEVGRHFQASDVESLGGSLAWHWDEAGIAVATSSSPTFLDDAHGGGRNIRGAAQDFAAKSPEAHVVESMLHITGWPSDGPELSLWAAPSPNTASPSSDSPPPNVGGPDVYAQNGIWQLYQISAATPIPIDPSNNNGVPFTPRWELNEDSNGNLVGSTFADPSDDPNVAYAFEGNDTTIAIVDSGMPAIWLDPEGSPTMRLHPDFDWYEPGDGGVIPIFKGVEAPGGAPDPYQYYNNYYADFATAAEKTRLPSPETVVYSNDNYLSQAVSPVSPTPLLEQPYLRGEVEGELRVIIDVALGGFDDADPHATTVAGILGARYSKGEFGAMRGLVPKARLMSYRTNFEFAKILQAYWRSIHDGVQVTSNSLGFSWAPAVDKASLRVVGRLFRNAMNEHHKHEIVGMFSAGNNGLDHTNLRDAAGTAIDNITYKVGHVMVVSGVCPRDYDYRSPQLPDYLPSPGAKGTEMNLDRPRYLRYTQLPFGLPDVTWGGTDFGNGIDIAAPAGSYDGPIDIFDVLALLQGQFIANPNASDEAKLKLGNFFYTTSAIPNTITGTDHTQPASWLDIGAHRWSTGTSLSAPAAAGVAALAIEAYTRAHGSPPSGSRLRAIVKKSVDDLVGPRFDEIAYTSFFPNLGGPAPVTEVRECDKPGQDVFYGAGRINARSAITRAKSKK